VRELVNVLKYAFVICRIMSSSSPANYTSPERRNTRLVPDPQGCALNREHYVRTST